MKIALSLTTAQEALAHPYDDEGAPAAACTWRGADGRNAILTCDVDDETVHAFGGPVWHTSVSRPRAEALLRGVGEGALFDEPGVRPDVYHLRRRMTPAEIERVGSVLQ